MRWAFQLRIRECIQHDLVVLYAFTVGRTVKLRILGPVEVGRGRARVSRLVVQRCALLALDLADGEYDTALRRCMEAFPLQRRHGSTSDIAPLAGGLRSGLGRHREHRARTHDVA